VLSSSAVLLGNLNNVMNIDRISVKGLFDHFDYELSFIEDHQIMLLAGPNGSGKTTILKLIDFVFNQSFILLYEVPFRELKFFFDDGRQLLVQRISEKAHDDDRTLPLKFILSTDGSAKTFNPSNIKMVLGRVNPYISMIEDFVPELQRLGRRQWLNEDTGNILELEDVLEKFTNHFPPDVQNKINAVPDWFQEIKDSINMRFISTERLTVTFPDGDWRNRRPLATKRAVTYYSGLLSNRIQASISEYGALSQSLDRSFPSRVVTNHNHSNYSTEDINKDLDDIKQKRQRLEDAGLLPKDHHDLQIPDLSRADDAQRNVLSVYANDAKKKLALFDDLYEKITVFKKIINSRFSHKRVSVNDKGSFVSQNGDAHLDLELLSSGEQHELVLLNELLFGATKNLLVLIDEPEISLHVAWQRKWLEDLNRLAKLSQFRAIVATHSPQIIADSWHLVVELVTENKVNGSQFAD